jgi:hypothetical protein
LKSKKPGNGLNPLDSNQLQTNQNWIAGQQCRDIYFFANSRDAAVDTRVVLRGNKNLALWNPHTGERKNAEISHSEQSGQPVTVLHLTLDPVTAVFFVQE